MRTTILFCFVIILQQTILAQQQMPTDWGAFSQRIDVKPYQGKKFRLSAALKVSLIDSTGQGEIWVRVDRPNKKMGFFYNMMDKPIRTSNWKIYTIDGVIAKDAEWLAFGGLYHRKGLFYFDNFKLTIDNKEVPVPQGDFEGDSAAIRAHWAYLQQRTGFNMKAVKDTAYSGGQSFLVDGSKFTYAKTYGNNDDSGHYVQVNNIRLYYETYGQGEPLLLLHGNSQSISSFYKQIPELSKHFRVIALDTRGQGQSTEDGKRFTYDLFAEDTKALLDQLHLDSLNALGWSDGGNIGLIMAIKYPEKVNRLAVMGANLYNNSSSVKAWVNKMLRKERKTLTDTAGEDIFRKRMIDLLLTEPNVNAEDLKKISCPVLVMAGSDDVIKEEHTKLIAGKISGSELVIFPKGNHYEPWERPERFNKT
ncbi:MAG TPA: alpha/beta hydrolase, partial [Chitinophagaceae bacterium]|nr:alpha/beta hydrolase [Chitinophagaceae bacterium]